MAGAGIDMMDIEAPETRLSASPSAPAAAAGGQHHADHNLFRVCLSKNVTRGLSQDELEDLQCEFADWFPGPVLLPPESKVMLNPKVDKQYKNLVAKVVEHTAQEPRIVKVWVADEEDWLNSECLEVPYSILEYKDLEEERARGRSDKISKLFSDSQAAAAGTVEAAMIIGYNEFVCEDKVEREYWLSLDRSIPPIRAGMLPIHEASADSRELDLCVVHVQYQGHEIVPSNIVRVSIRTTQSIQLRAHQEKCRGCHMCKSRRDCDWCKKFGYKAHPRCKNVNHDDCYQCPEFKWQERYGKQLHPGEYHFVDRISSWSNDCDLSLTLKDAQQQRFAFIGANYEYGLKSLCLNNSVHTDATSIALRLRELGFKVHGPVINTTKAQLEREVLIWTRLLPENAHALVFLSGHGMELRGKLYFVPIDYPAPSVATVVETAEEKCLNLEWIQERVHGVLRQHGLLMSFWDCCREDAERQLKRKHVVRNAGSGSDAMIRGMDKLTQELKQKSYKSAGFLTVMASSRASQAHQLKDGGVLTQALLKWWRHDELVKCSIFDEKVKIFVQNQVGSEQQQSEWRSGGTLKSFKFMEVPVAAEASANTPDVPDDGSAIAEAAMDGQGSSEEVSITANNKRRKASKSVTGDPEVARDVDALQTAGAETARSRVFKESTAGDRVRPKKTFTISDVPQHREEIAEAAAGSDPETPAAGVAAPATQPAALAPGTYQMNVENEVESPDSEALADQDLRPADTAAASGGKHRAQRNAGTEMSQDWSALGRPDDVPWPFTILFVGVDNSDKTDPDLNLKVEFKKIEQAYRERLARDDPTRAVRIKRLYFTRFAEVVLEIRRESPSVVHFGCHAREKKGLELFKETVDTPTMVRSIEAWNRDARQQRPPQPPVRGIIYNSCESDMHALDMIDCVDFAIGHQDPVEDDRAVFFTELLYDGLFAGGTLLDSFDQALAACPGYRLFARRDPRQFRLVNAQPATFSGSCRHDSEYNELIHFLTSKGLTAIAARFSQEMGMEFAVDLGRLQKEDFDDPGLSFLKRWHKERLLELAVEVTAHVLSRDESALSGTETASGVDSESVNDDIDHCDNMDMLALRHPGSPEDFREHIGVFLKDFLEHFWLIDAAMQDDSETFVAPAGASKVKWTFCMMLWLGVAKNSCCDGSLPSEWLNCIPTCNERSLLALLNSTLMQDSTMHPSWAGFEARFEFELMDCRKENAAAIFVTDKIVRDHLKGRAESSGEWQRDVVKGWFENSENASAILLRANRFLRQHVIDGISVIQHVVKTQSYVAFLRMPKLSSLLFFEYLNVRKLEEDSSAAAGSSSSLFHGFCMFVSSSRVVLGLTDSDTPAASARPVVFRGLRCLARLQSQAWEMLGVYGIHALLSIPSATAAKMTEDGKGDPPGEFNLSSAQALLDDDDDDYYYLLDGVSDAEEKRTVSDVRRLVHNEQEEASLNEAGITDAGAGALEVALKANTSLQTLQNIVSRDLFEDNQFTDSVPRRSRRLRVPMAWPPDFHPKPRTPTAGGQRTKKSWLVIVVAVLCLISLLFFASVLMESWLAVVVSQAGQTWMSISVGVLVVLICCVWKHLTEHIGSAVGQMMIVAREGLADDAGMAPKKRKAEGGPKKRKAEGGPKKPRSVAVELFTQKLYPGQQSDASEHSEVQARMVGDQGPGLVVEGHAHPGILYRSRTADAKFPLAQKGDEAAGAEGR